MKIQKILLSLLCLFALLFALCLPSFAAEQGSKNLTEIELYPGGMHFGAKIVSKGLTVVKFTDTKGENASSAYLAGIRAGDVIIKINSKEIKNIEDFVKEVEKNGGKEMKVTVLRNDKEICFNVTPSYSKDDGKYKTGIWVKDSTSGIGTITYIDPKTNSFGGLGHAICDGITGKMVTFNRGTVLNVDINGVTKGQVGTAGELKGTFKNQKIGVLTKNSPCGVFGYLSDNCFLAPEGPLKLCPKEEVNIGSAYIWCSLDSGSPQKYRIEITDINSTDSNVKNFKVKITDEKLLEKSGGIVQGMSGSPIIQNGRIVGAITHVLINDPTTGYGIFIENMLEQAS